MSFTVRRVGGGNFNPDAMCINDSKMLLFIGCGNLINIYTLPDLYLKLQCTSHKARVTCIACTDNYLVSGDSDGNIMFHNFNLISIIDKKPSETFHHKEPIEKIFIRQFQIYIVYPMQRMFWISEYSELKSPKSTSLSNCNSRFIVDTKIQKKLCDLHDSLTIPEPTWLRFPQRDNFDINKSGTKVVIADECKLHVYDLLSKKITDNINLKSPCRICRFRNDDDFFVFMQNGKFQQFGELKISDHWHYVCPNAVCFDETTVYSGGAEGVFLSFSQALNRHVFLPRIGMTIEGLAITSGSQCVAGVVDKNILVSIDPKANKLRKFISHIYGDIFFNGNIITSLRKPNLIQFFNSKTGECIEQLSVSSYNCRVPVTSFALTENYLITVETSGGENPINYNEIGNSNDDNFDQEGLSIALQAEFNHTKPHSNISKANEIYQNMLTKRRFNEVRSMLKMRYGNELPKENENPNSDARNPEQNPFNNLSDINFDINAKTIEGNPLTHDCNASLCVGYSEVKIWSNKENNPEENEKQTKENKKNNSSNFKLEQTFRIIGKKVSPLSMHPNLAVYAMVVSKELQLWRLSEKWQLWKSTRLGSVPEKLVWSPDGTILVLQFSDRLEIFDIEINEVIFTKMSETSISDSSFLNDSMMVIHSKDGIALFDLRELAITKRIFAEATCVACKDSCVAFVTNKDHPIIALSTRFDKVKKIEDKKESNKEEEEENDSDMISWELPTSARVKALNITKDKDNKISITAIDDCNFIWMIDEYGITQVQEERITQITPLKQKEVTPQNKVEIIEDKSKLILDLLDVPSHQIPPIDDLCAAMLGLIIDKRDDEPKPVTIALNPEEIGEEIEVVEPILLNNQDKDSLREIFAS